MQNCTFLYYLETTRQLTEGARVEGIEGPAFLLANIRHYARLPFCLLVGHMNGHVTV